ncbi:MAG: hypothetical protein QOG51_541 [Verrucomicrobiota bacterium]
MKYRQNNNGVARDEIYDAVGKTSQEPLSHIFVHGWIHLRVKGDIFHAALDFPNERCA